MPRCKISDPEFADDPEPIPLAEAIENAFQDWTLAQGTLSLHTVAAQHDISWETLRDRKNGAK